MTRIRAALMCLFGRWNEAVEQRLIADYRAATATMTANIDRGRLWIDIVTLSKSIASLAVAGNMRELTYQYHSPKFGRWTIRFEQVEPPDDELKAAANTCAE